MIVTKRQAIFIVQDDGSLMMTDTFDSPNDLLDSASKVEGAFVVLEIVEHSSSVDRISVRPANLEPGNGKKGKKKVDL